MRHNRCSGVRASAGMMQYAATTSEPRTTGGIMTMGARLLYVVVLFMVFSLLIAFRSVIEGVPLRFLAALGGAWLITKTHFWLRANQRDLRC